LTLRYLVWTLFSPSQLLLLTLVAGAVLLSLGRAWLGRWLAGAAILGLLTFGVLPGSAYLARPLQARFPQPILPGQVTGIILLTGAELTDDSEAVGLPQLGRHGDRYVSTLRLAARYPDARIVVSGSPIGADGRSVLGSQTGIAKTILEDVGVDPRRLLIEQQSADTCDNASNTWALVRPQPDENWVVVTSAMHMPRAIACFRAAGWARIIPQPDDYEAFPSWDNLGTVRMVSRLTLLDLAAHEWLGLVYYRLSGRTTELFPAP